VCRSSYFRTLTLLSFVGGILISVLIRVLVLVVFLLVVFLLVVFLLVVFIVPKFEDAGAHAPRQLSETQTQR